MSKPIDNQRWATYWNQRPGDHIDGTYWTAVVGRKHSLPVRLLHAIGHTILPSYLRRRVVGVPDVRLVSITPSHALLVRGTQREAHAIVIPASGSNSVVDSGDRTRRRDVFRGVLAAISITTPQTGTLHLLVEEAAVPALLAWGERGSA